eukprot:jgi/Ulvmu1/153/UM001_0157.1
MPASPVRVLVRLRPTGNPCPQIRTEENTVSVELPKKDIPGPNNSITHHKFTLDGVLPSSTQEDIFNQVAHGHVEDVLQGYCATIIAYGATGSGKSFSVVGQKASYPQRGILPRALTHVFHAAQTSIDRWINVSVSCLEIYNDQMYDLLADNPATASELKCQEDELGKITVKGLTKKATAREEDALKLLFTAEAARATARDGHSARASRSHFVFNVHLSIRTCTAAAGATECAQVATLSVMDLAGSERAKKAGAGGQWLREARSINRSLAFLEQTVHALAQGHGAAHIPYRQNRLTAMLKAALSGSSRTTMLVHVWPQAAQVEQAVTTLRFAECVRRLETAPEKEVDGDPEVMLRRYQRQVKELKQELAMRDTLAGREAMAYDDLGDADVQEINSVMRQVLAGEAGVDSIPTGTFREIQEAFNQSQALYQELARTCAQLQAASDTAPLLAAGAKQAAGKGPADAKKGASGKATPPSPVASPAEAQDTSTTEPGDADGTASQDGEGEHGGAPAAETGIDGKRTLPKAEAFSFFKHSVAVGREAVAALKEAGAQHRAKLAEQAQAATAANKFSGEVEHAKAVVRDREASFPPGAIDEEDAELQEARAQLRGIKDGAREARDAYARHGTEAEELLEAVAEARRLLMAAFEAWFADEGAFLGEDLQPFDPDETYAIMNRQRIMAEDSDMYPFVQAKRASRGAAGRLKHFAGGKAKGISMRKKEHETAINFGTVSAP